MNIATDICIKCHKVLVVSTDFPPLIGGTSRHTSCLCQSLANNGVEVHLLTYGIDTINYDYNQNYNIVRIKSKNNYGYFYRHLIAPIRLAFATKKLDKVIDFDIIHICNGNYIPLPLRFTSLRKYVIWTIHNLPPAEMSTHILKNSFFNLLLLEMLNIFFGVSVPAILRFGKYDHIISVSEFVQKKLLTKKVPAKKIDIIPNGVTKRISVEDSLGAVEIRKWFTILVVARVVEHKGQLELVRAIPKILPHIPNLRCIIAGETVSQNYVDQIHAEIKHNHIDNECVILTGKISDEEVNTYLSECDVYVQPSYEEGFCISIAEAMYAGVPVIDTETGAIPQFIGSDRGILLSSPDSDIIADAVIKYYTHPEIREYYANNGKKYIQENYDWDAIGKKTIEIYNKTLIEMQGKIDFTRGM